MSIMSLLKTPTDSVGQFRRKWHSSTHPTRYSSSLFACGFTHPDFHIVHIDKFYSASGEGEAVAGIHLRQKRLFDCAKSRPIQILHNQRRIAGDGSDRHSMVARDTLISNHVAAVLFDQLVVVRIGI